MDYCPLCEKLYVYDFYNVCLVFMGLIVGMYDYM